MATSGPMADFARLPLQKKVAVFAVIAAALGGLYFQFLWKPLNKRLDAAENENKAKSAMNVKLAADIPKFEALQTRMIELTAVINENQKALPTEAEVPAFFETLERKVTESGVEISKWKKLKEEPVETFVRVPVEIELTGTYMQIKRFFASLIQKDIVRLPDGPVEERDRIISVDNLSLTKPVVRNREIVLTARFVANTYRQDEPVASGTAPKAGAGAAPAGAKPPSPAAAGTPKGAKAMTEKALDQGDKVNRNAAGVDEAKTPAGDGSARLKGGI